LWRSRVDGSERVPLTTPPMSAALPRWSPDGARIAFFGWAGTWAAVDSRRIYVVDATAGAPRRLTTGTQPEGDPSWSPDGRKIAFGTTPTSGAAPTDAAISVIDLATGAVAELPGSKGFFGPRWSPDGRYILGTSLDSTRFVLFDVAAGTRSDLLFTTTTAVGWPAWSLDSRSVQYMQNPDIRRISIADHHVETLVSVKDLNIAAGALGQWFGWTPDGSPMFLLDAGTHDVYALDWEAP